MNSNWKEFLAAAGARFDQDLVGDFGDAAGELAAAGQATLISPLTHLGLLEVAGSDASSFLHNQLTSDVNHLASDAAQHSAWCSAKGRMIASFLVFRSAAAFRLQFAADLLPAVHKRLQMFVLRSQVSIADLSASHAIIGLAGNDAEAALRAAGLPIPGAALATLAFSGPAYAAGESEGLVIRLNARRFEIVVASDGAAALWSALQAHARPVGTPVWQWLDIEAGIPLISAATREEFVPQMANFDRLGAISFHKGCYPGQEIVARTQYLGKVKRHLYRAHSASPFAAGNAIYSPASPEEGQVGMVANAAVAPGGGYDGLAIVRESFVAAGELELAAPGGPLVQLSPLPELPPAGH